MKKVCVLGSGAFGTAIAFLLADNGHEVNIWCHEHEVAESINIKNINNIYLSEIKLRENILAFTDLSSAMQDCEIIFEAVPVKFLRSVLQQAKPYYNKEQIWVCASKGIENETLFFPSQIIESVFTDNSNIDSVKKVVISGPSFAREIAQRQLTFVDLASQDQNLAKQVAKILTSDYFKIVVTQDVFGVQIGGAIKNVAAIAFGILDGLGYKSNTKALMLNYCLQEIVEIAQIFGAQKETIYGLSGVSDLIATCYGGASKNFKFGQDLACDKKYENAVLPEGVNTAKSVYQIIQLIKNLGAPEFKLNHNIFLGDRIVVRDGINNSFPVLEAIHDIIFGLKNPQDLVYVLKNKK